MKEEFNFKEELEKWYKKWMRKPITGRCLIELKNRDEEFIRLLKEGEAKLKGAVQCVLNLTPDYTLILGKEWEDYLDIDKLAGFQEKS